MASKENFEEETCIEDGPDSNPGDSREPSSLILDLNEVENGVFENHLRTAIASDDSKRLNDLLERLKDLNFDINKLHGSTESTLLQFACLKKAIFATKALLEAGINPNQTCRKNLLTPLLLAASEGNVEILKLLMESGNINLTAVDSIDLTALHKITQKLIYTKSGLDKTRYVDCLRLLLRNNAINKIINAQDFFGNTPLHFAALSGVQEAILELLYHGAYLGTKNLLNETPIRRIEPSTLELYFDSCIRIEDQQAGTKNEFKLTFDYSVLAPPQQPVPSLTTTVTTNNDDETSVEEPMDCTKLCIPSNDKLSEEKVNPECEALWHLSTSKKHQHLLKHPLITSFLEIKWRNIRFFYFVNLAIYSISVLILTAYILLLYSNHETESKGWLNLLWYSSFICILVLFVREFFQLGIAPCCYIFNLENYTELTLLVCATLVLINWNNPVAWRHLSAIAVLLAWVEELLLLGRLPRLSIFVTTFKTVFVTFLLLLFWYSTLLVGFGLSFFLVFGTNSTNSSQETVEQNSASPSEEKESAFPNVPASLLKVSAMMVGEFDFGSLPFDPNPITSRMIFLAFLFLISIVLLNLLNGLAVSDTQAVQNKAEILCYVSRVELISYIESILLGDPFEFLMHWPPIAFVRRHCFVYSPILGLCRWAFINGFIPAKNAMLFYGCLPKRTLTFFPFRSIDQISSDPSAYQCKICKCHKNFRLDEHIVDSAISRKRDESSRQFTYEDISAEIGRLHARIDCLFEKLHAIT